jgi:hypothetical protein
VIDRQIAAAQIQRVHMARPSSRGVTESARVGSIDRNGASTNSTAVPLTSASKVLVEGDHAIAAVRWPLAMVLVAVAVAIVGVVVITLTTPCYHIPDGNRNLRWHQLFSSPHKKFGGPDIRGPPITLGRCRWKDSRNGQGGLTRTSWALQSMLPLRQRCLAHPLRR